MFAGTYRFDDTTIDAPTAFRISTSGSGTYRFQVGGDKLDSSTNIDATNAGTGSVMTACVDTWDENDTPVNSDCTCPSNEPPSAVPGNARPKIQRNDPAGKPNPPEGAPPLRNDLHIPVRTALSTAATLVAGTLIGASTQHLTPSRNPQPGVRVRSLRRGAAHFSREQLLTWAVTTW